MMYPLHCDMCHKEEDLEPDEAEKSGWTFLQRYGDENDSGIYVWWCPLCSDEELS